MGNRSKGRLVFPITHSQSAKTMYDALVSTQRRDGVLICHLDDGKANALSSAMIKAITAAIDEAEAADDVHAVVLHGREGKFCAGFDLSVMRSDDVPAITALVADGGELVRRIWSAGIPVIAACTGHALAAGALILLGCDVRIGSDRPCKIGLNEVAIGMTLPDWGLTIAAERLSQRQLHRAIPTARITDGAGAVAAGYLDEVVADAQVLDAAVAQAVEFAALSAKAYSVTVQKMRGGTAAKMAKEIAADRSGGVGAPLEAAS